MYYSQSKSYTVMVTRNDTSHKAIVTVDYYDSPMQDVADIDVKVSIDDESQGYVINALDDFFCNSRNFFAFENNATLTMNYNNDTGEVEVVYE